MRLMVSGLLLVLLWGRCLVECTLQFVHAIWRHGDRSPASGTFPTDTKNGEETWPQGWGELSTKGMEQHYALGRYLRQRYVNGSERFLSEKYSKYEIYVRSTSYNRTIMSALANLAGMFPPRDRQVWNESIPWQPIPVHSRPREQDPMLWMDAECPQEDKLYTEVMQSKEVLKIMSDNRETIEMMREKTGWGLTTLDDMWAVFDPLNCERHHNDTHKTPDWVKPGVFSKIKDLFDKSTVYYYYTPEIQRLRGGLLLEDIIARMKQKRDNNTALLSPKLKYYVYSAHDSTVNALLTILGAYGGISPPYAAVVLLELHNRNGQFQVDLLYKNDSTKDPFKLKIKDCSEPCTLDSFIERSQPLIPEDWRRECGLSSPVSLDVWKVIAICLICACLVLVVLLVFACSQLWKQRRGRSYGIDYFADTNEIS